MTAQATRTSSITAPPERIEQLVASLRGEVIQPSDTEYETARTVYNGMIDRHPGMIVRCVDVADVIASVNFAREQGLLLAIRGGGHNGAGLGTCDGGLVIDLSRINGVHVDPAARTARVGGGCTWGDVDHATHAFGLATPSGIISTTGVGGLTLGGGLGHLTRAFGLAIDNLLAVDMVLADGRFVTASAEEHDDLFWAVRGGGGNFGVVTSFLFQLHPLSTVVAGPTLWPLDQAGDVMRWYREFIVNAPEELNGFFAFLTVPPAPPFPEELHLQAMCGVVWCYTGPAEEADAVFAPVLKVGTPALHGVQPMPYPMLQGAFDGLYPPGDQWYWKADFVRELSDEAIAHHIAHGSTLPTPKSTMHLYAIDGAAHRAGTHDTAWSYRDATWGMVIAGVDPDPANADRITTWAKTYWEAVHPYSAGGAYVNMMMDEGEDRVRASYRDNYPRLVSVKNRYDPANLFRVNQNIRPAPDPTNA
ncbi:MAG: oxidoreductase, FAD-dependent [uncultured Thermomicrobiales bacterium]|uniref:Oxidoreductase, FAD-dependent n=1 Tax=uncultured Thermomicrobiales bacterium TaxID=1645740 RepID=A0A6J4VTJ3_9BACT|nr:MAG: oxidoreductase, FAD-dependent [uncultured Thermomicrobiales bacterium]